MNPIGNGHDRQITVGLDIGASTITCAIGQIIPQTKRVKLLGISTTASAGFRRGTITNRDELIEKIEKALTNAELMASVKVTKAILSITGDHIRCLNTQASIALNRSSGRADGLSERSINDDDIYQVLDLAQAVSLPVDREILHTLPQAYLVDTLKEIKNPIGMTGRRLEGRVHLVTAATTAMKNLVSCVEELGITVDGLVYQPLASALATLHEDEMELGVTLVEIGSSTTNIAVYHGSAVRHSAIIPIGSSSITNDIAVMLQISIDEAENIKMKYASARASMSSPKLEIELPSESGQLQRSVPEQEISRYVEARMHEIFQMVIREISRADIKDPLTYGIVMTGGGAQLRNIVPLAENSLGVKVRQGKPIKIDGAQDIADKPRYSTVMGLLLWPFYANDHIRMQKPKNQSLKSIIKKIRHTIEEMF
jgi:cell division protein FtsA